VKIFRNTALLALLLLVTGCTAPQASGAQCTFNADCASGLICAANYCRTACGPNGTCPAGMRCEPVAGTALTVCAATTEEPRCAYASDCPAPLVCNRDGRCRPECREDYDCQVINPFTTCAEGSCALRCTGNGADCDGLLRNGCEVDTGRDVNHCGACGTVCRAGVNQSVRCEAGACAFTCAAGFADCDGNPGNGCEASLGAATSCGSCTTRCEMPTSLCQTSSNGARSCVSSCSGETPLECAGRCVNPQTEVAHCGACGNACPTGPNATARCAAGRCGLTCAANFGDCDNDPTNGCETDLRVSPANCGSCGRACALMSATAACVAGACTVEACTQGFGDCDERPANGCEASLTSVSNCGACGNVCGTANATATCGEGCNVRCNSGFGNCDENDANGCEANLSTLTNCRACGNVCGTANATATCGAEGCVLRCSQGFGNCDGDDANGCETNLTTSDANCGACGVACGERSTQTGVAHACTAGACLPRNDTCDGAQVIDLAAPSPIRVPASNRYARRERSTPCTEVNSADVWFRFTLTRRELVYVDTASMSWDTVLYFATGCNAPLQVNVESSESACNDDIGSFCKTSGGNSQIVAVLNPGTYYVVLSGSGIDVGDGFLNVQHIPLGNGSVQEYPLGFFEGLNFLSGTISNTSGTAGTCGGNGGEASYWWVECPNSSGGRFIATTCSPVNQGFNTVLYLRHGDGAPEVCNNDNTSCPNGPRTSALDTTVVRGGGIHALTLDTFDTAGPATTFELRSAYPYFEATPR
jgi:hypothetical protein